MHYSDTQFFHVAHARDLVGWDRVLYRALEMLPGLFAWGTIITIVLLSIYTPHTAAYVIIAFDLYWLLKTIYLSMHMRYNWKRMRHALDTDWRERLQTVKYEHLYHMVILPFYKEGREVVEQSMEALLSADYDKEKLIVVLAAEERAGEEAHELADEMVERYGTQFGHVIATVHPDGLPGEIRGKGPNITYAAEEARARVLDPHAISYDDVIVSAFDIDTVVASQYFLCLSWHFATTERPHNASFQPVPLYNNNLWHVPAFSRVVALTATFWQMIQQERTEKLTTFSSHAVSFKALHKVGYWQKNMISDDSRIFWNLYLAHDGDYRVVPLSYPVSMDANAAESAWGTFRNIYRQNFRWMWGVENVPYMLFGFIKNKAIPLRERVRHTVIQLEGWWSGATHPLIILLLGWLPLILGGEEFRTTVLSYNLPYVTRNLMIAAMIGLIVSAYIAHTLTPPMPAHMGNRLFRRVMMHVQWILVPITMIIFGTIPALHAQTRLMLGRYVGAFWVTPKHRVASAPADTPPASS